MTQLLGSWQGSGTRGRIVINYTRTYNADHTAATFDGDVNIEFDTSISDSVNNWSVSSPDFTDSSGSNLSISFGSGGGTKHIKDFNFTKSSDGSITGSVSNIEATGTTVNSTFTLDIGALAPTVYSTYYAGSISSTSFATFGLDGTAGGSSRNNTQVEYNTAPNSTGSTIKTVGSYSNTTITGLTRATGYYFRMRVSNTGYGYGPWGPWVFVQTLSTIPATPSAAWSLSGITQTSVAVLGISEPDNGGVALDQWLIRINTSPVDAGSYDLAFAGTITSATIPNLLPGTLYYVWLFAHNGNGYSPASDKKSFTTLPGVSVNVAGVWKNAAPWVNVGGVWKSAVRYVNVGGVWKQ